MKNLLQGLWFLLLALSSPCYSSEEILGYDSKIQVRTDGSLLVEETIQVRAEGLKIKRGIYRDFPTDYKGRMGNRIRVNFELLGVSRDGQPEPYHTQKQNSGIRIYAGSKNITLSPGIYSYTLRYVTTRQLGFFDAHDELYWNVTGNTWDFPINRASAQVTLPASVPMDRSQIEGYTGPQGAKGAAYRSGIDGDLAWISTTAQLNRHEGLTLALTWPKGYIVEPDSKQRMTWFMQDNRPLLLAAAGIALLLLYYLAAWFRVGRDLRSGLVIPQYHPPEGYSPASLRFIRKMGYDKGAFGAALVNMAVAGYLRIKETSSGVFTLEKTGEMPKLAPGEGVIASSFFGSGSKSITLEKGNHERIGKAIKGHRRALTRDYEKNYFVTNRAYLIPGLLLTIGTIALALLSMPSGDQQAVTGFMALWLSGWSIGVFFLTAAAWSSWRNAISSGKGYIEAIGKTAFAIPFFAGEIFGFGILFSQGSPTLVLMLATIIAINVLFYQWLKAPTMMGRKLLDKADGFRLFLSVAEKDELDFKHPPEKTPELFERFLPFAIALDVEQQWAERFTTVLARIQGDGGHYRPTWYQGRSWDHHNLAGFGSTMGSAMNSAISSASTAPGSSSGSGGGGSSGGGGGGGGGGGW